MKLIDDFLNTITMYRLVLYVLLLLLLIAGVFCFLGILPFDVTNLFFSFLILLLACWLTNKTFAKILNIPTNLESVYITVLILCLVITPVNSLTGTFHLIITGIFAIASKFIFAINKKHIFNPAAISLFLSFLLFKFGASWWIGSTNMFIPILIGGLLVVKKIRRFSLVLSFFITYLIIIFGQSFTSGNNLLFLPILLESSIFFFAFIMLTEPQTTPPKKTMQMLYGGIVGVISSFFSFEIALILGNVFSYIVSPKDRLILKLKEKIQVAAESYDFVFKLNKPLDYSPGQYMEWTIAQENPDSRGSRRYFTLASSPNEEDLRIGIKFYPNGSSFKKTLFNMKPGDQLLVGQLSGEFTLPKDHSKKLVFIAGGIGITPFRSMIKYLLDEGEKRDIVLLYSNNTKEEIAYKDIFNEALNKLGIEVIYINTDTMGFIDAKMIKEKVSDFKERIFYISGPHSMIDAFKKTLKVMGVKDIKTDFFPGYV